MLSFIDYEKKSNPVIQGLCAINSPVIAQLTSLPNGRFLIPQGVSLADKPGVLEAGLTDDFLRDHAITLSPRSTESGKQPQLFLSLSGVFGIYDEAETQILNVFGRIAIPNIDMFFKSPQNVTNFFAANISKLKMSEKDISARVQASVVLLREDILKRNDGSDLPFTLVSEVIDSKSYKHIRSNTIEATSTNTIIKTHTPPPSTLTPTLPPPSPVTTTPTTVTKTLTPTPPQGGAKTDLLIDFGTNTPPVTSYGVSAIAHNIGNNLMKLVAPLKVSPEQVHVAKEETNVVVRDKEYYLGPSYEESVEGRDAFFVSTFIQSSVFTDQVKPKLDEFIQSYYVDYAKSASSDTKVIQDTISQIKKTYILNSGFANNEEQNASIICGLENYLTSILHNLYFNINIYKY